MNGVLAVFSAYYPFKTPAAKVRFIVNPDVSQHHSDQCDVLFPAFGYPQMSAERAQRAAIREQLGALIAEGTDLLNVASTASAPPPQE